MNNESLPANVGSNDGLGLSPERTFEGMKALHDRAWDALCDAHPDGTVADLIVVGALRRKFLDELALNFALLTQLAGELKDARAESNRLRTAETIPLSFAQLDAAARDAQITFCLKSGGNFNEEFARAVERAHGIWPNS